MRKEFAQTMHDMTELNKALKERLNQHDTTSSQENEVSPQPHTIKTMTIETSRQSLGGQSIGKDSVGSMKIGGLARRKHTKQVSVNNAEYKKMHTNFNIHQQPDSPRISINADKIQDDANIMILTSDHRLQEPGHTMSKSVSPYRKAKLKKS